MAIQAKTQNMITQSALKVIAQSALKEVNEDIANHLGKINAIESTVSKIRQVIESSEEIDDQVVALITNTKKVVSETIANISDGVEVVIKKVTKAITSLGSDIGDFFKRLDEIVEEKKQEKEEKRNQRTERGANRTSDAIVVSLCPDVCKTPIGSSVVPVPYPIFSKFSKAKNTSPNVNLGGNSAFHDRSYLPKVTGNEAGKLGSTVRIKAHLSESMENGPFEMWIKLT